MCKCTEDLTPRRWTNPLGWGWTLVLVLYALLGVSMASYIFFSMETARNHGCSQEHRR